LDAHGSKTVNNSPSKGHGNTPGIDKDKLNDPFFASRLEKMSKLSLGRCMYTNEAALAPKRK